jgi:YHS domain-containing protein
MIAKHLIHHRWFRRLLAASALALLPLAILGAETAVNVDKDGVAIEGHDPVAYFLEGRAVPGSEVHRYEWAGAVWQFSNSENLDLFRRDPESYAPKYGGYCAWAVAQGYAAEIDPDAFTVHNGKLYLNYSKSIQRRWDREREKNIAEADRNWPALAQQKTR